MAEINPGVNKPLLELINRSGFPFELAVAHNLKRTHRDHGFEVIGEYPWSEGYLDLLLCKNHVYLALECKRVDSESWSFLVQADAPSHVNRCRLEYFNSKVPGPSLFDPKAEPTNVFCSEFSMCEGSPESSICVVPKGSPIRTLEQVCRPLLHGCHEIIGHPDIERRFGCEVIVPVIVTNAPLRICRFTSADAHLATGKLTEGDTQFDDAPFVRFRKSMVPYRSNIYDTTSFYPEDLKADSERTVFVVNAQALGHFLFGFRAFGPSERNKNPPEFDNPPQLENK